MLVCHELFDQTRRFIDTAKLRLAIDHGGAPGVAETLRRLEEQDLSSQAFRMPQAQRLRGCRLLSDAMAGVLGTAPELASQIAALEDGLYWKQNPNYSNEAMQQPGYFDNYGYAEIIGPDGIFPGDDYLMVLFLLGPELFYPEHSHPAPELYWPLTGPHDWRWSEAEEWTSIPAGQTVWHDPNQVHATRVGSEPFLALTFWLRDVGQAGRLVA